MGRAGRQFRALVWKNWLCRIRHPVLSLAEFFWPCILFMILTVLRFQEPPRHRDNCYLQPRDLPSRGVFPFVQGLLCNTGSRCRNTSYEGAMEQHFRSPRLPAAAAPHQKVDDLAFLKEIQDLAQEVYEVMDKARNLQKLWVERSKTPDSPYGSSFLTMDLNKTEDVIGKLESLHQQPHLWDFLLLLPRLYANNFHIADGILGGGHLLDAVLSSLSALEDLDWLPLNHTFSRVSEMVLKAAVSTLAFLRESGAVATESGYSLSVKELMWDPQKVQADLKSRFGFDDLHAERVLNYSADLQQIPTDSSLEQMLCLALSGSSEDEDNGEGRPADCDPRWSAAKDYLVHAVSRMHLCRQVFDQWWKGSLFQQVLAGIGRGLEALRTQSGEGSQPWKVARALQAALLLLNDSVAADGPEGSHTPARILLYMQRLQSVLQKLPPGPAPTRLLELDGALRNAVAQDLHLVREILVCLEASANNSRSRGPGQSKLEKDVFFKLLMNKSATSLCLSGCLSERGVPLRPRVAGVQEAHGGLTCGPLPSSEASALHKLLGSVQDANQLLQAVITGHTGVPVSIPEDAPDWQGLGTQLREASLPCTRLLRLLRADVSAADCEDQLFSTVMFHTFERAQSVLEHTHFWKAFRGFVRKTCEAARYVNERAGVEIGSLGFSEESPCYKENMDWKSISDNYFAFLNNLIKTPIASMSRVLNYTKELLVMEKKLQTLKDEQINFLLSFMEFLEKLLLPNPFNLSSILKFYNLPSVPEMTLNTSHLWTNHSASLERDIPGMDTQKLLEVSKEMIEKVQTHESFWIRKESINILRFVELILLGMNPKFLALWMNGTSKGKRAELGLLPTLVNFSDSENEMIHRKSFNFSQLFHLDWSESPAMKMDFVHVIEVIINSLYEFGFLRQEQVSEAVGTVYAMRNASNLFLALSEPQKQDIEKILTHIYLHVFQDKDSALLLQIYSSFHQYMYKFLSIQSKESLLSLLMQISKHILDILKQFNFQNISKAFSFLYETTGVLGRLSEISYCQQLLSIFKFLELKAQSLMSTEGPAMEVIHATLRGLKQLFMVDDGFRNSVFQYVSQLLNGSAEALLGNECFVLDNKSISSANYSPDEGSPFILPWAQILSNFSADGSEFHEFTALHCTTLWLHMWTELCGHIAQIFELDTNVFTSLRGGLNQLLDELESDEKIPESCQEILPNHYPARLILNLFKNVTQSDGFHDWNDFLNLRDLWVALGDGLVRVKLLNLDQIEKSLFTMETTLSQLKSLPLDTNASREFLYSLLNIFIELSNTSASIDRSVHLMNNFLLRNLTNYEVKLASVITDLRDTVLFLKNVSHDQDLLSCADIFQNVTEFILEGGLLYENSSQRALHILAMLNSTFSSVDTVSRLKGCVTWVSTVSHLCAMYNSSFSQGHLHGVLRSLRDVKDKLNSTLKLVTWMLNIMMEPCSLNTSNINCVNVYLKNVTDFLNVLLTTVFGKEKVPNFEILLTLLNDSTNQVRMIINNFSRDFDFAPQSNWTRFTELILKRIEMSDEMPLQFQNIWLHLVALGKEIQNLVKDISPNILENSTFYKAEKILNIIATSPKEKDIHSLGNSFYQLASYLAFNLSHDLQNSPKIISHEVMRVVGLSIQLMRDVFNSLTPSAYHNIPQEPGDFQVLKKMTSLLRSVKKTDIYLLVDQLERISESTIDFFKNISRLGASDLGIGFFVDLMEKFVDSSHSWSIKHLLRLSRLFPKKDADAVVDAYYMLPHAMTLLRGLGDKNITEALKDVYNFTLLHGIHLSDVTKEDFTVVIKTLMDTIDLVSAQPGILSETLTCLPVFWCWSHTTSGFQQNPRSDACNAHELTSSFYSKVASILDHLHLSPHGDDSQCLNESSQMEITRKVACVIHELMDWSSILLELSEVFHVKTSLVKSVQEFWHKVLPFVPLSGNQSSGSIPELCPGHLIKQVALPIIEKFKNFNFTKVTSDENLPEKLVSLNKILNVDEGAGTSVQYNISFHLKRIIDFLSRKENLVNSTNSLVSPFMTLLNSSLTGFSLEALSWFIKKSEAADNLEKQWLEFEQIMKDLTHNFSIRPLYSEIDKVMQRTNSVALQNIPLPLAHFLESLDLSSLKTLEIIEEFLLVIKNWFHKFANEDYSKMIQTLFLLLANESSTDDIALVTKDIATFLDYLKNVSREGNFDVALLTRQLSQEQLTNFSVVQLLFESFLINSINNLAEHSQGAALNLSDTDLQIMNLINLVLNHTQSENGERMILPPRSRVGFMEQLLKTFFLLKENSGNKIFLLLKDIHKDLFAEMSFVLKDKILENLKLDHFLTSMKEDRLVNALSTLKETVYHLIKNSFMLDDGELYFDNHQGLQLLGNLFHTLLRETSMKKETENNLEFLMVLNQLLSHMNSSEDLFKLNQDLQSALHLVRETSMVIARFTDTLLSSPVKDLHVWYPSLQEVILANLNNLLSFVNNSFPLRNRETLEITRHLLGVISGAGGENCTLDPLLEMSDTLTMLADDGVEMRRLAMSVTSTVEFLKLAKKIARKVATIFQTHLISTANDTMKFFDTLYFLLRQNVRNVVNEMITLKKADHLVFENIDDLLMPFLDLAFGMIGVKPNISQDLYILNMSSGIFTYMNQSKELFDIREEIVDFLTSVKTNLGDVERLLAAFKNGAQIFSVDSVSLWEEILDYLAPVNNITSHIDFLYSNPISTHNFPQDTKWGRTREVVLFLCEILSQNRTELGSYLRMVINLISVALWNDTGKDHRDVVNLLLTLAPHPDDLLKIITTVVEASREASLFNTSWIQNVTEQQLQEAIQTLLSKIALVKKELLLNSSQWTYSVSTLLQPFFEIFIHATTGTREKTQKELVDSPDILKPLSRFEEYRKALIALVEYWRRVSLIDQSVLDACRTFLQSPEPADAVATLWRMETLAQRVLVLLAEDQSLTKDVLCAALHCEQSVVRLLLLSALRGVVLVHDHYQELEKIWTSPHQLSCEGLRRNLSRALESFRSSLEDASEQDCECQPGPASKPHMYALVGPMLAQSLEKTLLLSGNPVMTFLSNFTVAEGVKVKDLMQNISKLTEELRSLHFSDGTINSILEANISHSKVLSSALTVALSGSCDRDVLRLLLQFPEDGKSESAARELCGLPRAQVFSVIVVLARNLDLRNFVYKTLLPAEASTLLSALLDVVSSLSHLLPRAGRVLERLPAFLHEFKITALLDAPDFQQASQSNQARSSAIGSFQSLMKMVCKDQAPFFSSSDTFLNLPRVNELLGDDKEKFNIPEDSTPFCLKLYQEILQSPNGALVWSFLKPVLHGKILYTPNTPEINKVIQKVNHTFDFVGKLKTLSEILLKVSSIFQSSGNGQMLHRLQEALKNKFIRSFIKSQLHIDVGKLTEKLQIFGGKLDAMLNHTGAGRLRSLGRVLVDVASCVRLNRFRGLASAAALEATAQALLRKNTLLASIIFNSSLVGKNLSSEPLQLPPQVTYSIRTSILYSMRTDLVKNPFWKFHPQSLPADGFKYNYIFVPLQDMIERAIISVQTGQEALDPAAQAQAIPYPCHTSDLFLNNVGFFFPLIMMLTWMVSVASMVRKLVYEREIQLEEYMRMMGVHPAVHFLAWLLENVAVLIVSSAALALILKVSGVFTYSSAWIVFLFLLDFGVSVVTLSYLLSALFSRASVAALCSSLLYTASFLPYIVLLVLHDQLGVLLQTLLCLLSTTAFGQGVFFITFLEGQEEGIQWDNMYQSPELAGMTFGWVCWMILFDSGLYFVCGWYLNNLIPGTFGLRKPWYFPFTTSYWKDLCGLVVKRQSPASSTLFSSENLDGHGSSLQNGEGKLEGGSPGVVLLSVTKEHDRHKAGVWDLTLTFHRDQITALLGTNGAGKTTVISLLTGLYPPTAGTITVNGRSLQKDPSGVRAELGVCLQRDILFDHLTVLEHLLLFASLKVLPGTHQKLREQVHRTLQDVGLTPHQHQQARVLSGGTRRKLSIGIAFLGASRTVVLDEPTSGVDPCSRRGIWDILLKYRRGRTIIFTTHHLDEAEALSDHVAVLQWGRLRCSGPPASLTQAHAQGLCLTLSRQPSVLEADDPKDTACATSLIQTYIPQASLRGSSRGELSYMIPEGADRACFEGLFQALDQNLHQLHLTGYGLSDTTLEEVFLHLLQDSRKQPDAALSLELAPPEPGPGHYRTPAGTPLVRGGPLLLAQTAALLRKRLLHAGRAWKGTISDLLLPVLFVALAMALFMVRPLAINYPPLKLTLGHYDKAETYFFSSDNDSLELAHVLLRKFGDQDPPCADANPDLENSSCWHTDPSSPRGVQESCGCLKCPNASTRAPYLTNHLGHQLLNLSGLPLEEYLLAPTEKLRLGGWSFGVQIPDQVQDTNLNMSKPPSLAKVWYNQKGFHSLPSYLNHLNNLILWRHLPPTADWRQYGITLYSHPYGGALLNEDKILESIRQCGVALCIVLGFSILSASIGSSVVRDRVTGAKRLQHMSGLGYRTYWLTNFLFDMLFYLVSVCLCVSVIVAFQLTAFTFRENLAATALLLVLFGYATLPWMYLVSRVFSSSDVAFISYISLNFIFGLCTMLMTVMPRLLAIVSKAQNLQNIYDVLKWVFTIFPQFCLGQGLIELCYNQIRYDLTHNFGIDSYVSPFEMNFLGWIFVQLAVQGSVLLLLRVLLHRDLWLQPRGHSAIQGTVTSSKDIDVEKEQVRVLKGRTNGDTLVLYNLSKSYRGFFKSTTAVQDISLGVHRGECFGLLGVNGAGKTTTFKMLTGDLRPSSGHAVVRTPTGEDVTLSLAGAAGIRVGYCPQQDALDELLTGWEHLRYYCCLHGIPKQSVPKVAGDLVRRLHLEAHVDKPVATYSGGTKRKLSTALALLGKPDLLLLDEPSSGMDPCSKRHLWEAVRKEAEAGCAVVLSSHSMEECEAVCTRLAIMVHGSFRCLGSPQHIKNRFGDVYTVKVWLHKEVDQHSAVSDCLKLYFPGIQFKGQRLNLLEYHMPKRQACLANLFRVLEDNKSFLNIRHYSINQTTLEQIFVNFATEQWQTPSPSYLSAECDQPRHLPV
ncbi:ATP-binding cassette sub-family A member 13 [Dama dama]|uniref:ATP-binding cassette sub-family A member 13 n=1 Tax=Dama dama TaxID=30532 RepID=UPI002A3607A1|nr:ATP-binding cassette sub-family A member 13 [Dama dama]